jgi:membrane associated rhomboid family serine protease
VLTVLIVLVLAGGIAYRVTTPEEQARAFEVFRFYVRPVADEIERSRVATAPFRAALRSRTAWAIVAPLIMALNVIVFARMVAADITLSDAGTLITWGANVGARTTNGEWGRLVTATFVHAGLLHLVANLIGLVQLGKMLERLVGPVTVTCVYLAAGVFANLVSLYEDPLAVHVGASGAIFGLYGLLAAVTSWGLIRGTGLTIPLIAFRSLAPTAAIFILYTMATDGLGSPPNVNGFFVGLVGGLLLTRDIGERKPAARPVAIATAVAAMVFIALAIPLRGVVDVRPEIARVVEIESRTSHAYRTAVERHGGGRTNILKLTELINGTIVPQLQAEHDRVATLTGAMAQHQSLVSDAEAYLRLREASWRLRAEALQKGDSHLMREAEQAERASLEVLERLRSKPLRLDVRT